MPLNSNLELSIADAYAEGRARFGDLGLTFEIYANRVLSVAEKCLGTLSSDDATSKFVKDLHGRDLYLATACAQESLGLASATSGSLPGSQAGMAWKTLDRTYRTFINDLARLFFRNSFQARDLADNVLPDLFLPDRHGNSRIVSYDGRSSLSTWLRVIVCNQAINARRRSSYSQCTEITADIPDLPAWRKMDDVVRFHRYQEPLKDSLAGACQVLNPRERLILLWRYQEGLQLGQIAQLLGIHQSNVTRQLERLKIRLRKEVVSRLSAKHRLSGQAIQECLRDLVEKPIYTIGIMDFLKEPVGVENPMPPQAVPATNAGSDVAAMRQQSVPLLYGRTAS
jgi:RNA polymerase sigma factor (sigma-70 family)